MKRMRQFIIPLRFGAVLLLVQTRLFCSHEVNPAPHNGLRWAIRMAESMMNRKNSVYQEWDDGTGAVLRGFEELWLITGERKYLEFIQRRMDLVLKQDRAIQNHKDRIDEGRVLLFLYEKTEKEKYRRAAEFIHGELNDQARDSVSESWNKTLYLGAPFYAEYGKLYDGPGNFDDVVSQFVVAEEQARDPEPGLSHSGRDLTLGWYATALVDVLDQIPSHHPGRRTLLAILRDVAKSLKKNQDSQTRVWHAIPDQQGNVLGASATSLFVYALAKAVRKGYIELTYQDMTALAYKGMIENFISVNSDGTVGLNQIRKTSAYAYGMHSSDQMGAHAKDRIRNDRERIGLFIAASVELHKLDQP